MEFQFSLRVRMSKSIQVTSQISNNKLQLAGGPMDKVLFGTTLALIAMGTVQMFHFLYLKSYKK